MSLLHYYQIFDYQLVSDCILPELQKELCSDASLLGRSITFTMQDDGIHHSRFIDWFHNWETPQGATSIICGRTDGTYFLQLPNIAVFEIHPNSLNIICYPETTNLSIVRHMLLDQVIPRLLFHRGELVIHASAVLVDNTCLIFLGATGQGKSTLAMALCMMGSPILSDDCLLLRVKGGKIIVLASYCGARLLEESVMHLVPEENRNSSMGKTRLDFDTGRYNYIMSAKGNRLGFFALGNSKKTECVAISRLKGGIKAAEMLKHCFYLDPTDPRCHNVQFVNIVRLLKIDGVDMFSLNYPREYAEIAGVCENIIAFSQSMQAISP